MVEDAEKYRKRDRAKRHLAELRNQADALIYSTEKAIEDVGDKLDKEKLKETEDALQNLKDVLKEKDRKKIKEALEELNECSQELFTAMYAEVARREEEEEEEEEAAYKPIAIPCPKCKTKIIVTTPKRPTVIKCPKCGTKGTLKAEKGEGAPEKGKKPKEKEDKPTYIPCPKCKSKIEVTSSERPLKIKCKKCGAKGTLHEDKGKKKEKEPSGPPDKPKKVKEPSEDEEKKPKKAKEPSEDEEKKPEKEKPPVKTIKCPNKDCDGKIKITSSKRPLDIECPKCGKKGTLKK